MKRLLAVLCCSIAANAAEPENILIKPVAVCANGQCTMSEADFKRLQLFHAQRMIALVQASEVIDSLQAQNELLLQKLARFSMGCEKRLANDDHSYQP